MSDTSEKTLLRFTVTGSVDDGKSTLLGRLLYDTKAVLEDQFDAVKRTSERRGMKEVDLALLLDGLSAEREQGITIDVAYRYFETAKRKFIIADCPGHVHYTRNMVTGASTADLAVLLIDARQGVVTQSKRHAFIASLLQIPHMIVAVNKMDLVDYSQDVFTNIVNEFTAFAERLDIHDITFVPVSALKGDNVVFKSEHMPWYDGFSLLHSLETMYVTADRNLVDFRFPVQYVVRPNLDFRGFAGRVVSGTVKKGEHIAILPSGRTSVIKSIETYDGSLDVAFSPQSVVLTLEDEIDISRGDMIVRKRNIPELSNRLDCMLCWMDEESLNPDTRYILKHTSRKVKATFKEIVYRVDVDTLHREKVEALELNDIARVELVTSLPLFFDRYHDNRTTGSFILIDPLTNNTVAAGMIRGKSRSIEGVQELSGEKKSPHTVREEIGVTREDREQRNGHKAAVVWLTGLSGAGKSTIARALLKRLYDRGCQATMLDGDNLRHGLCHDLGFSEEDREENIRRVGEVARLFYENGMIIICSFISPFRKDRHAARALIPEGRFFEVYVQCALDVCQQRDPKGLYQKALAGEISGFTGLDSPYEEPETPEMTVHSDQRDVEALVDDILVQLSDRGILSSS